MAYYRVTPGADGKLPVVNCFDNCTIIGGSFGSFPFPKNQKLDNSESETRDGDSCLNQEVLLRLGDEIKRLKEENKKLKQANNEKEEVIKNQKRAAEKERSDFEDSLREKDAEMENQDKKLQSCEKENNSMKEILRKCYSKVIKGQDMTRGDDYQLCDDLTEFFGIDENRKMIGIDEEDLGVSQNDADCSVSKGNVDGSESGMASSKRSPSYTSENSTIRREEREECKDQDSFSVTSGGSGGEREEEIRTESNQVPVDFEGSESEARFECQTDANADQRNNPNSMNEFSKDSVKPKKDKNGVRLDNYSLKTSNNPNKGNKPPEKD